MGGGEITAHVVQDTGGATIVVEYNGEEFEWNRADLTGYHVTKATKSEEAIPPPPGGSIKPHRQSANDHWHQHGDSDPNHVPASPELHRSPVSTEAVLVPQSPLEARPRRSSWRPPATSSGHAHPHAQARARGGGRAQAKSEAVRQRRSASAPF